MWKPFAIISVVAALAAPALAYDAHHPNADKPQAMMSQPGQPMTEPGTMGGGMMGSGMGCHMMGMMHSGKPHTEGHLAFLKAELQISNQQETAWAAFANSVRGIHKPTDDMQGTMGSMSMAKKSAPDAMQMHIHMMESMLGNLKTLQAATSKLYGVLNADQKATADELLGGCMGHM